MSHRTRKLDENLWRIRLNSVCGLVVDVFVMRPGDRIGLVDTEFPATTAQVDEGLSELGMTVADVTDVFYTHPHVDHMGGSAALAERPLRTLVPRPDTHRVKYHGLFASASPHRSLVVPAPSGVEAADDAGPEAEESSKQEPSSDSLFVKQRRIRRLLWAELVKRTFGVDPKECPQCGGRMKIIATIMRADVVTAILRAQGLPTDAPFIRPCRGPPSGDLIEVWWT